MRYTLKSLVFFLAITIFFPSAQSMRMAPAPLAPKMDLDLKQPLTVKPVTVAPVIAQLSQVVQCLNYCNTLSTLQTQLRAWYKDLPHELTHKKIQFLESIKTGAIITLLKRIETQPVTQALDAYAQLSRLWPWDHRHSGFVARTPSYNEKGFINVIGCDVMRAAQECLLTRPDILAHYGTSSSALQFYKEGYGSPTRTFTSLYKQRDAQGLNRVKSNLAGYVTTPSTKLTPAQRVFYQAQLIHADIFLRDLVSTHMSGHGVSVQEPCTVLDVHHETINALTTSHTFDDFRQKLLDMFDQVLNNARLADNTLAPEVHAALQESVTVLNKYHNPCVFIEQVTRFDTILQDLHNRVTRPETCQQSSPAHARRSFNEDGLVQAFEKFFRTIGEKFHEQINITGVVQAVQFATDVTLGKLYLPKEEYTQRIDAFWQSIEKLAPQLDERSRLYMGYYAARAACSSGLVGAKHYLRKISAHDALHSTSISQALRNGLDKILACYPFLVTAEGVLTRAVVAGATTAQEIINQSQNMIREVINSVSELESTNALNEGFVAGTPVNTTNGPVKIEDVRVNDVVSGHDYAGKPCQRKVTAIYQQVIPAYKAIIVGKHTIYAAPDQKFYQLETASWVTAGALKPGAVVRQDHETSVTITSIKDINQPISIYAITVEGHEYTITESNIDVHNVDVIFTPAFVSSIVLGSAPTGPVGWLAGVFVLGVTGIVLYKKHREHQREKALGAQLVVEKNIKADYARYKTEQSHQHPLSLHTPIDPETLLWPDAVMADMKQIYSDYREGTIPESLYKALICARPSWDPANKALTSTADRNQIKETLDQSHDPECKKNSEAIAQAIANYSPELKGFCLFVIAHVKPAERPTGCGNDGVSEEEKAVQARPTGCFEPPPQGPTVHVTPAQEPTKNTTHVTPAREPTIEDTVGCGYGSVKLEEHGPTVLFNHKQLKEESDAKIDNLIKGIPRINETDSGTDIHHNPGTFEDAVKDFENMGLSDVQTKNDGTVRVGLLPDGRRVIVREYSKGDQDGKNKWPTIDVQRSDGKRSVLKMRYTGEKK